ncbi:DUF4174 domain-containing protein [Hellea balneolensis]|uniref:DUF4174 domain-containing protein n=1 Tax=Hellea balneolensis TaxID=287478 RepID=UPI00040BB178|nr:DUF4174 domain-containing protein [Hellea balneolensis]
MIAVRRLFIILCLCTGIGCYHASIEASEPTIYSKMLTPSPLGKDSILGVCSGENTDSGKINRFYKNTYWDEFIERDLVMVEISKRTVSTVLGITNANEDDLIEKAKHHDYSDKLRQKAACKNAPEFILIGKDTGVKARWYNDFTQEDLFSRIDAMPMRRYEMRNKRTNN